MSILENGKVRMANLAIVGSHSINGVAALHTEILKNQVFKDFYEEFPERFINVTNGVTQRRWLLHCNPELAKFLTKRIGDGWITDFPQIKKIAAFAGDAASQEEFMAIKKKNKLRLIEFINQENKLRNSSGLIVSPPTLIDPNSLFDVQVKRIHEYKRQLLNLLHIIMMYHEICDNPNQERIKRTCIIGGKAAASYDTAKDIIRFAYAIARRINRDHAVGNTLKVVYIENYNVSRAELILPAADLSEQISTAGTEASGTGNMKMAINGALTIGTDDGANIEMREEITDQWWPFGFGCSSDEITAMKNSGSYRARDIYESNAKIRRAVDTLRDRTFATNDAEHHAFSDLYHKLVETHYGEPADRYFTLKDLESYCQAQKRVEELYQKPNLWAEFAIHNIAGMGKFSADVSINNYCQKIWGIVPCAPDEEILERIRHEYSLIDKCRIF
jgi:starch phosphorylase